MYSQQLQLLTLVCFSKSRLDAVVRAIVKAVLALEPKAATTKRPFFFLKKASGPVIKMFQNCMIMIGVLKFKNNNTIKKGCTLYLSSLTTLDLETLNFLKKIKKYVNVLDLQ